jgi:hypothetical protein
LQNIKLCDYGCGKQATVQIRNGKWCCCKSPNSCEENKKIQKITHNTKEYKNRCSEQQIRRFSDPENKEKHKESLNRPETRKKKSEIKIKYWSNLENRKNLSKIQLKRFSDPEIRRKNKEILNKEETKKKLSESAIKYWSNPENKKKHKEIMNRPEIKKKNIESHINLWKTKEYAKNQRLGRSIRPNKPEVIILNILNDLFPNEWKYTGDFSFMINGKNPDFTNINGQKKLIELFGDYYHKDQNPEDRINIFKEFGWKTLVIWEHELKNINEVKLKIKEFHFKENKTCLF